MRSVLSLPFMSKPEGFTHHKKYFIFCQKLKGYLGTTDLFFFFFLKAINDQYFATVKSLPPHTC